jgi:hypothetical protein
MDLGKLFDLNYMFNPYPGDFKFMPLFIGFFLVITIGSFYLEGWIKKNPNRSNIQRIIPGVAKHLRFLGLIGFLFLWARHEHIPYFSMRAALVAFIAYIVWTIGNSIYKYKTQLNQVIELNLRNRKHRSYLPKQKKKRKPKRKSRR